MRQELFNQGETDYAYNLLNNTTIQDVDRIYELRRLINERLPNPWGLKSYFIFLNCNIKLYPIPTFSQNYPYLQQRYSETSYQVSTYQKNDL